MMHELRTNVSQVDDVNLADGKVPDETAAVMAAIPANT